MEATPRRIEIFAPFEAAFALTRLILFKPFNFKKWCVIGFAAFLANLAGSFGGGFNFKSPGKSDWKGRSHEAIETASGLPGWAIGLIIAGAIIIVAIAVALVWVSARGKFVFADCVVRNRGAIVEPWKQFKREGNSYFLFTLAVALVLLTVMALASLPLWLPFVLRGDAPAGWVLAFGLVGLGVIAALVCCAWALISRFMIPIMYRRRCGAREGFRGAMRMVARHPGPIILFALFSIVLWVAVFLVACAVTCLTCCIAAIPYVGTVIFLPLPVFFMSYVMLFARQFGHEYDAWGNLDALNPPAATPPPLYSEE